METVPLDYHKEETNSPNLVILPWVYRVHVCEHESKPGDSELGKMHTCRTVGMSSKRFANGILHVPHFEFGQTQMNLNEVACRTGRVTHTVDGTEQKRGPN